jgi:hypothetical protein
MYLKYYADDIARVKWGHDLARRKDTETQRPRSIVIVSCHGRPRASSGIPIETIPRHQNPKHVKNVL